MKVNLYTLVRILLPTFLRSNKNCEFVRAMIMQIEYSFNLFNSKVPDWMYKSNTNASTVCLEHHIKRELDVDAIITVLDGKPVDFLVTVNGFVDENQLKVLIDTYKLAGKSYIFKVGSVEYTAAFKNHVCEDIREGWTAVFSDYICEDDRICNISAVTSFLDANYQVQITSDRNVQSDVTISGRIYLYTDESMTVGGYDRFSAIIPSGNSSVITIANNYFSGGTYFITVIDSITPTSDSFLNYNS